MIRFVSLLTALLLCMTQPVLADRSDYIWNIQFEKKLTNAQAGDTKAQYDIGNMYLKGQGTNQDANEAFKWFQKAADKGHMRAEYKLGFLYYKGDGVNKNGEQAFKWLSKSANKGYTPAQFYIGKMYSAGIGVDRNYSKAYDWFKKADGQGYFPAKAEVKKTAKLAAEQKSQQAAANRRAQQQVRPAPAPRRPVVVAAAKPKKPARSSSRINKNYLELLTKGQWYSGNDPALFMPSLNTSCKTVAGKLTCLSPEVDREESYGVVTYKIETTLNEISAKGQFTGTFRDNVTLVFPNDPDDPEAVIPIDYGWQKPVTMSCIFKKDNVVVCQDANQRRMVFSER